MVVVRDVDLREDVVEYENPFKGMGFSCCESDNLVWVWSKNGSKIIVPVYVNDLTLASNNLVELKRVKTELARQYKLCDLGELHMYLVSRHIKHYILTHPDSKSGGWHAWAPTRALRTLSDIQ